MELELIFLQKELEFRTYFVGKIRGVNDLVVSTEHRHQRGIWIDIHRKEAYWTTLSNVVQTNSGTRKREKTVEIGDHWPVTSDKQRPQIYVKVRTVRIYALEAQDWFLVLSRTV
jgi:hypothetical protein